MEVFLAGLGLGLSLIVAIGSQNAFVLRQGLRGQHVLLVTVLCAASDVVLIAAGVAGLGSVITAVPWLLTAVRYGGAAFLVVYAVIAARRALWPPRDEGLEGDAPAGAAARTALQVAGTCLALTWLNPHVYLDTVVLLGSISATYADARWLFGAGAITGSIVWFFGLAYGARLLRPALARPWTWRVLDGLIALVMLAIAASLVLGA